MITQTVEYALRAAVLLASEAGKPMTAEAIARRTRVPAAYLAKVMQLLARAGLVTSQRGIGGGFTLAHAPREVTILRIVNAVEPLRRIETCPLGLPSHGVNLCPLHRRLDNALAQVERAFAQSTLQELLDEPTSSVPLCDAPTLPIKPAQNSA